MYDLSSPKSPNIHLSPEEISFYNRNGYLKIEQISNPEELAALKSIYDRLFADQTGRETGNQFDLGGDDEEGKVAKLPQILGPSNYAPEMRNTQIWANALYIVRVLADYAEAGIGDHAILKPAQYGAPTPWHQDEAYWDPGFLHNAMSIWVPLQDADERSGCLSFVPASHLGDVVPHRQIGGDKRVHGLEIDPNAGVDFSSAVSVPLKAGGCTIHHNRTMHYAPANTTDEPRRAWILGGGAPGVAIESPNDYYWQKEWQTARQERAAKS
jgi:hypothetical protein